MRERRRLVNLGNIQGRDVVILFVGCTLYHQTLKQSPVQLFVFCVRLESLFFHGAVILVGERHEGSAPLVSGVLVAYEAHQGLVPDRSSYIDTDESFVIRTLYS